MFVVVVVIVFVFELIVRSVYVCVPLKKKFFDVDIKHTERLSVSAYYEETQKSVFWFNSFFFIRLF